MHHQEKAIISPRNDAYDTKDDGSDPALHNIFLERQPKSFQQRGFIFVDEFPRDGKQGGSGWRNGDERDTERDEQQVEQQALVQKRQHLIYRAVKGKHGAKLPFAMLFLPTWTKKQFSL
jgi:hypothetical protein